MKPSLKIFLIFPLLTTLIAGCYKNCDEFNKEILDWMPYRLQEIIIISKSIGIVAIIEKNRNWIILDNNTRNINTSDLNYFMDGCD